MPPSHDGSGAHDGIVGVAHGTVDVPSRHGLLEDATALENARRSMPRQGVSNKEALAAATKVQLRIWRPALQLAQAKLPQFGATLMWSLSEYLRVSCGVEDEDEAGGFGVCTSPPLCRRDHLAIAWCSHLISREWMLCALPSKLEGEASNECAASSSRATVSADEGPASAKDDGAGYQRQAPDAALINELAKHPLTRRPKQRSIRLNDPDSWTSEEQTWLAQPAST